jgi:alpha,alpha-trehalase
MMIMGLDNTGDEWAKELAFEMTEKWVRSNYKGFNESGVMYEKVSVVIFVWCKLYLKSV